MDETPTASQLTHPATDAPKGTKVKPRAGEPAEQSIADWFKPNPQKVGEGTQGNQGAKILEDNRSEIMKRYGLPAEPKPITTDYKGRTAEDLHVDAENHIKNANAQLEELKKLPIPQEKKAQLTWQIIGASILSGVLGDRMHQLDYARKVQGEMLGDVQARNNVDYQNAMRTYNAHREQIGMKESQERSLGAASQAGVGEIASRNQAQVANYQRQLAALVPLIRNDQTNNLKFSTAQLGAIGKQMDGWLKMTDTSKYSPQQVAEAMQHVQQLSSELQNGVQPVGAPDLNPNESQSVASQLSPQGQQSGTPAQSYESPQPQFVPPQTSVAQPLQIQPPAVSPIPPATPVQTPPTAAQLGPPTNVVQLWDFALKLFQGGSDESKTLGLGIMRSLLMNHPDIVAQNKLFVPPDVHDSFSSDPNKMPGYAQRVVSPTTQNWGTSPNALKAQAQANLLTGKAGQIPLQNNVLKSRVDQGNAAIHLKEAQTSKALADKIYRNKLTSQLDQKLTNDTNKAWAAMEHAKAAMVSALKKGSGGGGGDSLKAYKFMLSATNSAVNGLQKDWKEQEEKIKVIRKNKLYSSGDVDKAEIDLKADPDYKKIKGLQEADEANADALRGGLLHIADFATKNAEGKSMDRKKGNKPVKRKGPIFRGPGGEGTMNFNPFDLINIPKSEA